MELFKRLKLIETCISLQDHALIELQLPLLKSFSPRDGVDTIIYLLEQHNYVQAQQEIAHFLNAQSGLVLYEDAQISAIQLELSAFEQKLQAMILRRDEAQNRLQDFNREYHLRLGAILLKILSLQEQIAAETFTQKLKGYRSLHKQFGLTRQRIQELKHQRNALEAQLDKMDFMCSDYHQALVEYQSLRDLIAHLEDEQEEIRQQALKEYQAVKGDDAYQEYKQAQENTHSFENEYLEVKETVVARLSGDEAKQLKSLYRKACRLSHPDLVSDELKQQAHDFMVEINAAYVAQDIPRLQSVLVQLENNGELARFSSVVSNKDALLAKLAELKAKYEQVQQELNNYEASDEYQTVIGLGDDWDSYFDSYQQELEVLVVQLEESLASISSDDFAEKDDTVLDQFYF